MQQISVRPGTVLQDYSGPGPGVNLTAVTFRTAMSQTQPR